MILFFSAPAVEPLEVWCEGLRLVPQGLGVWSREDGIPTWFRSNLGEGEARSARETEMRYDAACQVCVADIQE